NVAGVKAGGAVQTVTTALKILPLLILAAALLPHGTSANLIPFAPKGWGALFPAIALVAWPFLGSETATVPAEEIADASRTIRRATFSGFGLAAVVYFLVALAVAAALSAAALAGSPSPMAVAARRVFGPAGESLVAIGALVSIAGI